MNTRLSVQVLLVVLLGMFAAHAVLAEAVPLARSVGRTVNGPYSEAIIKSGSGNEEQVVLLDRLRQARLSGNFALAQDLASQLDRSYGLTRQPAREADPEGVRVEVINKPSGSQDKWQGNDVLVAGTAEGEIGPVVAGDNSGNLYAAVELEGTLSHSARIYRSTDGGESWALWLQVNGAEDISQLSMIVAEGTFNRLFLAFRSGTTDIKVLRVDLADPLSNTTTTIMSNSQGVAHPRLAADGDEYFPGWYVYLVFNTMGIDNWALGFSRSIDTGDTWSAEQYINVYSGLLSDFYDGSQGKPDIDFGNGNLHLVFDDIPSPHIEPLLDVFTMYSEDFGLTWTTRVNLTNSPTRVDSDPVVAAVRGATTASVVVAYTSIGVSSNSEVRFASSHDAGGTWAYHQVFLAIAGENCETPDVVASPTLGRFHMAAAHAGAIAYGWANYTNPEGLAGSATDICNGMPTLPSLGVNRPQTEQYEAAIVWQDARNSSTNGWDVYFDGPTTVGLGTIVINPDPDFLNASWHLSGPNTLDGIGDIILNDMEEGNYTLTLNEVPDWTPVCPNPWTQNLFEGQTITFDCAFDYIPPLLTDISDVGNDQGRQVRLTWDRSGFDAPGIGENITGYSIFRRRDGNKAAPVPGEKVAGWDWLAWLPAYGDDVNQYVAPTLCDSTASGGICQSAFFIRASTADPFKFFDSPVDSGYSVDNLAPAVPTGGAMSGGLMLAWDEPIDADFDYFTVYGSETGVKDGSEVAIGYATGSGYDASGDPYPFYLLTATDFAGNESGAAAVENTVSAVGNTTPSRTALLGNHPNPFNPATTISYEIAQEGPVSLEVFDLSGRLVRKLVQNENQTAGRHEVRWSGRDEAGRKAASGTYLYRLEVGSSLLVRTMVLVK